jgi:hypothetical protein
VLHSISEHSALPSNIILARTTKIILPSCLQLFFKMLIFGLIASDEVIKPDFMTLTPKVNVIKLFMSVRNEHW